MDYLIGTRFHSVIFSQISRVPCLAVAYGGNKSQGIMAELDISEFVVDINAVSSEKLNVLFDELRKDERIVVKNSTHFFQNFQPFGRRF